MRHCLLLPALLGLSMIQCSSSDGNKSPRYPDSTTFCRSWAQAQCSEAVVSACLASSREICVAERQGVCETDFVGTALSEHLAYDSSKADLCIAAVSAAYSDAKLTNTEEGSITKACELVFSGTETKGASCTRTADCKQRDGLECIIHYKSSFANAGDVAGTCQVPATPLVAGGASCSDIDQQCTPGYHCGTTSHCDEDEPLGSNSCSVQAPCVSTAQCVAGTCVAKAGTGESCTVDADCTSGYCVESRVCAESYTLSMSEPFCLPMHS